MEEKTMSKSMKWLIAALALSLAFNVFIVGVSIGKRAADRGMHRPDAGWPGSFNTHALGRYLTPEQQDEARALLKENRKELRERTGALRRNERKIKALIVAEEVDKQELAALIDEHEALMAGTHIAMRRLILEFVAGLDVETRRAVADDLFRKPRPRTKRHGAIERERFHRDDR